MKVDKKICYCPGIPIGEGDFSGCGGGEDCPECNGKKLLNIQEVKTVWVAFTNTDLTEGRGYQIPKAVCETEATARRLGHKGYVQGGNCPIEKYPAIKANNTWFIPGSITEPSKDDERQQARIDQKRGIIAKAKSVGLTDEDLKTLGVT